MKFDDVDMINKSIINKICLQSFRKFANTWPKNAGFESENYKG